MNTDGLAALLDSLPSGTALLGPDLRIRFASRALEGLLGQGREALVGQPAEATLGPEAAPLLQQALGGETATQRLRVQPRVGSPRSVRLRYRPWYVDGAPAGVLLSAVEAEDGIAAAREQAAQEQEEVQRIARIGTYHTDLKAGTWTASEGFCRIFGFEPGGVYTTEDFQAIVHPDELGEVMTRFGACIAERRPFDLEYRCVHRITGEVLDVRSTSQILYDADGNPDRIVGIKQDITDRKQLERQFHAAQRAEALGRLAGGIAHDFNNVLTAIMGYTELAGLELSEGTRAWTCVDRSLDASRRARDLVQKLLAFSVRRTVAPRAINLNESVTETHSMLERVIGDHIALELRLEPALWNTRADRSSVEQVLMNLAVNARDAMPDGGRITLETGNTTVDRPVEIGSGVLLPAGDYVRLSLSDTGTGMDEETRARAFEPFFSTKEEGRGSGLGLATCFGLVTQAGGQIAIYSELGHGTTMRVYLPRHDAEVEQDTAELPMLVEGGDERVLVAEDDEDVRLLVREVLEAAGYAVSAVEDGERALAHLDAAPQGVDLLVTDVVMPNMGGRQLEIEVRERHPGVKVLFMSGFSAAAFADRAALPGGTQLIEKPFTQTALLAAVRRVLDT